MMFELHGPRIFEEPLTNFERILLETSPALAIRVQNIEYELRELAREEIDLIRRSEILTAKDFTTVINARDSQYVF